MAVLTVALGVLIGCSPQTKRKWLTTFFDGVPQEGAVRTNRVAIEYDEDGRPLQHRVRGATNNLVAAPAPFFVKHPPFEEKKCLDCHESRFSVRLRGPEKQVCFTCHTDFIASSAVKHLPADNGECTDCHAPHGSQYPVMLKRPVKELCFECHEDVLTQAKFRHQPADTGACSTCHNPHASANAFLLNRTGTSLCFDCHRGILTGEVRYKHAPAQMGECTFCHRPHESENKFLLVRTGKDLCFQCHDDFLAGARFKHVAVEDCSACHFAHQSNEPMLLIKNSQQMCYGCHVKKDMLALKGHETMGDASCLKCHNPHGGDNKALLKPGVARPGAPGSVVRATLVPAE